MRRLLLVIHWALPAVAAVVTGAVRHQPAGHVGRGGCVRGAAPIHTGPLLRAVMIVVYTLSPGSEGSAEPTPWLIAKIGEIGEFISTFSTFPSILLLLPFYLFIIVLCLQIAVIFMQSLFVLMDLESRARQAARDRAAQRIMTRLRDPVGAPVPRFSLYLRPFKTTGHLASLSVGVPFLTDEPGNVQTDFEAILASAFPAHRPLIALGTPGALLSTHPEGWISRPIDHTWEIPGTGKVACTETDWREKFMLLARHAETIVIVPLNFAGTIWEIRWLHCNSMLPKCVFVMPASMLGARDYVQAWQETSRFLTSIDIDPPEYQQFGRLFLLNKGTLRLLPSFIGAPVPRATALLIQFALLRRCNRNALGTGRSGR